MLVASLIACDDNKQGVPWTPPGEGEEKGQKTKGGLYG